MDRLRGPGATVAGMMDMSWRSFMIANVVSALLCAPAYLIPGMAFGARRMEDAQKSDPANVGG